MSTVAAFFGNYMVSQKTDSRHFSGNFESKHLSDISNFGRNFSLILHYRIKNGNCSSNMSMDSVIGISYR